MGIMTFIRCKPRKLSSGEIQKYYYEVENYWENGKTKQRVIRYIGKNPYPTQFDIKPDIAKLVSQIIVEKEITPTQLKSKLESIGIPISPGELKEVQLRFKPPLKKYSIRVDCA